MATIHAPKQWSLTKTETITPFESCRQNLQYTLALDQNFARFLVDGFTWLKKTPTTPLWGLTDDGDGVPEDKRHTAEKSHSIRPYARTDCQLLPSDIQDSIVKNSISMNSIWQAIPLHYGFSPPELTL